LSSAVLTDEGRIKKGKLVLEKTIETTDKLKIEKESLELLLKTEKAKLPDLAMLSKVKTWHVENKNLLQQLADRMVESQKFQKEIDGISETVKARFKDHFFTGLVVGADLQVGIQFLKEKVEQLKKKVSKLDIEMEHYRVQAKLEEYAVNLHDGEACPLCGSLQHPTIFSSASVTEALTKALENKENLEKEIIRTNENMSELSDLLNQLKFNTEHLNVLSVKLRELETKISEHAALFKWEALEDENAVNQKFAVAEAIQKLIREKEEKLVKVVAQLENEIQNKERFQVEIEKIKTALTISQTEIKTLSEQIRIIHPDDYRTKTDAEIDAERQSLMKKYESLERQFNDLTNRLAELRKAKDTVSGSLEANTKELSLEQETNFGLQKQLSSRLVQNGYSSIENVKCILDQEINLELQKQKLTDFRQQMALLQTREVQLKSEIANRTYDNDTHQKLLTDILSVTESLNHKNQELGKLVELLQKLKTDLENQALLRKNLENIDLRAGNIKMMKTLFKGSGFVNYISSVYLQNLCNAANDRFFQLTRQKLSLEITDDNNFQVRDFMNGGKVRNVKTLSGGQTFQAALSLALALADNIQKITESNQNFFFLDEGFGSLDKDSLSVVFDTLKSLRKENRIVGVISHVEEMQQEIDVHLRIENQEDTGSRILTNWN
jgi:exonuclease SbcC